MIHDLEIQGLDPLLFGNGRPFSADLGAMSAQGLPLPYPSTLTGALKTAVLGDRVLETGRSIAQALLSVKVRGPLLQVNQMPQLALPADALPLRGADGTVEYFPIRPSRSLMGANLPIGVELLCEGPSQTPGFEPIKDHPARWMPLLGSCGAESWLGLEGERSSLPESPTSKFEFPVDSRVHVAHDLETKVRAKSMLFETRGVSLKNGVQTAADPSEANRQDLSLLVRMITREDQPVESVFPLHLGGERRIAWARRLEKQAAFCCPQGIATALKEGPVHLRMVLATPAQFAGGSFPAWGDRCIPGTKIKVRLVSALVRRREFVSGWGYSPDGNGTKRRGPKPLTWLAPAGSVYFFEVTEDTREHVPDLVHRWLKPVSDSPTFAKSGFGLAMWGTWKYREDN